MGQVSPLRAINTGPARAAVPPPLPGGAAPSQQYFSETDDDLRRLMADIDRVLSGRPDVRLVHPLPMVAAAAGDPLPAQGEADEAFQWRSAAAPPDQETKPGERAAGWIQRARRERRSKLLRAALSWSVALMVGGVIVGLAAVAVQGGLPDFAGLDRALQSLGL